MGNCSSDWETVLLRSSNSTRPSTLEVHTKTTNSGIFNAKKLLEKSFPISGGQEGINLVGKQPKTEQWEITSEFKKPRELIASDASTKGWEAYCQGQRTGGHGQS